MQQQLPTAVRRADARGGIVAAATRDHDGTTIYFCSKGCAETFDADPHRYAHGPSGAGHH